MSKLPLLLLFLTSASCVAQVQFNEADQVETWSDANYVLARAGCDLQARCDPAGYSFAYGSGLAAIDACIQFNSDALCYGPWEGNALCQTPYPVAQLPYLQACPANMAGSSCFSAWDEGQWPQSCNLAAPWTQG